MNLAHAEPLQVFDSNFSNQLVKLDPASLQKLHPEQRLTAWWSRKNLDSHRSAEPDYGGLKHVGNNGALIGEGNQEARHEWQTPSLNDVFGNVQRTVEAGINHELMPAARFNHERRYRGHDPNLATLSPASPCDARRSCSDYDSLANTAGIDLPATRVRILLTQTIRDFY